MKLWPFKRQPEFAPWEIALLNNAAAALNDQKTAFLEAATRDEELQELFATLDADYLGLFERAFLWGFFRKGLQGQRVDEYEQVKKLIEARYVVIGESIAKARAAADLAAKEFNSGHALFDTVAELGEKAHEPTQFPGGLREFMRMVASKRKNK